MTYTVYIREANACKNSFIDAEASVRVMTTLSSTYVGCKKKVFLNDFFFSLVIEDAANHYTLYFSLCTWVSCAALAPWSQRSTRRKGGATGCSNRKVYMVCCYINRREVALSVIEI